MTQNAREFQISSEKIIEGIVTLPLHSKEQKPEGKKIKYQLKKKKKYLFWMFFR